MTFSSGHLHIDNSCSSNKNGFQSVLLINKGNISSFIREVTDILKVIVTVSIFI